MIDREKVIEGLSCCEKWMGENDIYACYSCPYHHGHFSYNDNDCRAAFYNDVMALLEEIDTVSIALMEQGGDEAE